MVDLEYAYKLLGPEIVRCGNIDPVSVLQQKSAAEVSEAVKTICNNEKERRFIISGGCEITVQTPVQNLNIMRTFSKRAITK